MRVVVAEKPSVARDLARVLGANVRSMFGRVGIDGALMVTLFPFPPSYPDPIDSSEPYVDLEAAQEVAAMDEMVTVRDPEIHRAIETRQAPRHAAGSQGFNG